MDSSVYELLRRGFLTQIVDFSNKALSQSSSKWIPLSGSSWGRDSSPKLLSQSSSRGIPLSRRRNPMNALYQSSSKGRGLLIPIVDFSNKALPQSSSKGIPLSRSSGEGIPHPSCCLRAHPEGFLIQRDSSV